MKQIANDMLGLLVSRANPCKGWVALLAVLRQGPWGNHKHQEYVKQDKVMLFFIPFFGSERGPTNQARPYHLFVVVFSLFLGGWGGGTSESIVPLAK